MSFHILYVQSTGKARVGSFKPGDRFYGDGESRSHVVNTTLATVRAAVSACLLMGWDITVKVLS